MTSFHIRPGLSHSIKNFLLLIFFAVSVSAQTNLSRANALKQIKQKSDPSKSASLRVATGFFCTMLSLEKIRVFAQNFRTYSNDSNAPFFLTASLEPDGLAKLVAAPNHKCTGGAGYIVSLTSLGIYEAGNWKEESRNQDSVFFKVPFSTIEILEITGIKMESDRRSIAEFNWRIIADKQAATFKVLPAIPPDVHTGSADFDLYDDGWRIAKVHF